MSYLIPVSEQGTQSARLNEIRVIDEQSRNAADFPGNVFTFHNLRFSEAAVSDETIGVTGTTCRSVENT